MKLNKKSILGIISSLMLVISIVSFFFTAAVYKEENIKLSLIDITFGLEIQGVSIGLLFVFFGIIIALFASIVVLFKNNSVANKIVITLGLVFGIMLFFTSSLANPSLSGFKIYFTPFLSGITSILGSFISLINEKTNSIRE